MVAGIDGCPGGWMVVEAEGRRIVGSRVTRSLGDYLANPSAPNLVAIDIPIGLTDRGPRPCDGVVRCLLRPRHSSVFPAPIRPALRASTRQEAAEISLQCQGKSVSAQAFAICTKIREVDDLLTDRRDLRDRAFEIHPELCFAAMNGIADGSLVPMPHPKRSGPGFMDRLALADGFFGDGAFESIRACHRRSQAADDDILDAMAAAWTGLRLASGHAHSIPDLPATDALGLPMAMWY